MMMVEQAPELAGLQLCLQLFNAVMLPEPLSLSERVFAKIQNQYFMFYFCR